MLRSAVETTGKTAALVTPDRTLARRVAARLKRYELAVDDSAGVPVAHTVPGAFLDLVLGAAETDFAPPGLMALLKHPLALLGRSPGEARSAARALERGAFRCVYVGEGLEGARAALHAARSEAARTACAHSPGARGGASSRRGPRNRVRATQRLRWGCGGFRSTLRRGACGGGGSLGARCGRLVIVALAGRCRRSPLGAPCRADRGGARHHARSK